MHKFLKDFTSYVNKWAKHNPETLFLIYAFAIIAKESNFDFFVKLELYIVLAFYISFVNRKIK